MNRIKMSEKNSYQPLIELSVYCVAQFICYKRQSFLCGKNSKAQSNTQKNELDNSEPILVLIRRRHSIK